MVLKQSSPIHLAHGIFFSTAFPFPAPLSALAFPALCSLAAVYLRGGAGSGMLWLSQPPNQNT